MGILSGLPFFMWSQISHLGRTPGISSANGISGYEDDPYGQMPAFDYTPSDETRHQAAMAGSGALAGGLLDSMFNRGQGMSDAFKQQREASQGVLDRAEQDARQQYLMKQQQLQYVNSERYRREQEANLRADNKRADEAAAARAQREVDAEARKQAQSDSELHRQQGLVDHLAKGSPEDRALAEQLRPLIGSEHFPYGEAVSRPKPEKPDRPDKPDIHWENGTAYAVTPNGMRVIGKAETDPEAASAKHLASVNAEVERRIDDWAAHLPMSKRVGGISEVEMAAKRGEFRSQVEDEMTRAQFDSVSGGASRSTAQPDAKLAAFITAARTKHQTDAEITSFLKSQGHTDAEIAAALAAAH